MTDAVPLVSILMPFYNAEAYIEEAIESVWAQTHPRVEFIAIDDGSTDGSLDIVREMATRATIAMRVETQANAGPSATLHRALGYASGEWICWLAADDSYSPHFVDRNLALGQSLDGDVILHCNSRMLEADGSCVGLLDDHSALTPLRGRAFEQFATGEGRMHPSTMFIRRELLLRAGGFDPTLVAEDHDLTLRLARHGEFHYITEPLFNCRRSPDSLGKKPWLWGNDIIDALTRHRDLLGRRLPAMLTQASSNVSVNCFEHGGWGYGVKWAGRTIGFAPGARAKTKVAVALSVRIARAMLRRTAYRLIGRERLYRAKRALLSVRPRASGDGA